MQESREGYLLKGTEVPGFFQNVPGPAVATAGTAAVVALIFATAHVVTKMIAEAAAAAAAAPAAAPAVPGTFWQNPGTPGNRYPFCPG